jgi:hypothetical protein
MTLSLSLEVANAQLDIIGRRLDGGYLRVYSGPRPPTPDDPVGAANILLAECRFASPAFERATNRTLTARAVMTDPSTDAAGRPTFYRCLASDGRSAVADGSVGAADADLILNTPDVPANVPFELRSFALRA